MIFFYSSIVLIILLYFGAEYVLLSKAIKAIPLRILVNGTRGKSTTVKLIYNILKNNELKTYAKITGDNPILYNPDGSSRKLKRFSPASIKENIRLLIIISKDKPDAFVMECMALQKETQNVLGKSIFSPHYSLITNVLPDHQEVMGETIEQNVLTLIECVDKESILIITEETNSVLQNVDFSHNKIEIINTVDYDLELINIPQDVINESWSIIRSLIGKLNVDETIAKDVFNAEWKAIDSKIKFNLFNSNITILNLFSINDLVSTEKFVTKAANKENKNELIFILNSRMDRPLRTKEFAKYISNNFYKSNVWLIGNGRQLAKSFLIKNNFPTNNIHLLNDETVVRNINNIETKDTLIYCVGNHKGTEDLIEKLKELTNNKGVQK